MGIVIRRATTDDASAACHVLCRSITECCELDHRNDRTLLDAWLGNKNPETVAGWFSAPSNCGMVAECDGKLVGVGLVTQAGKICLCYVLPEVLGTGVGSALLLALEQQAREWGVSVLKLNSTRTASAFYQRHGYIHEGQEKVCFGLDCEFFWKKLDDAPGASRKRYCSCNAD